MTRLGAIVASVLLFIAYLSVDPVDRVPDQPNWGEVLASHRTLQNAEDLKWLLAEVFRSQATCEFSSALLARVTRGGVRTENDDRSLECLGRLRFLGLSVDPQHPIASIEVRTKSPESRKYFILFVISEDQWLMYPPTPAGLKAQ